MNKASVSSGIVSIFFVFLFGAVIAQETGEQTTGTAKGLTITTDGVTTESMPAAALDGAARTYRCELNGVQRRVEVQLLNPPAQVPCEVNYYKETEQPGIKATLWSANNDAYFCETQAQGFIEKLQGMGWHCE